MAVLRVTKGPNRGQEFELTPTGAIVGRLPSCNVVLEHRAISRTHAKIECVADEYFIEDLSSRNGIRVNGQLGERHRLCHNDRIAICGYELSFENDVTIRIADDESVSKPLGK